MFMFREGVELNPVLEPSDVRSGLAPGHAHEADLPAEMEHLPVMTRFRAGPQSDIFTGSVRT